MPPNSNEFGYFPKSDDFGYVQSLTTSATSEFRFLGDEVVLVIPEVGVMAVPGEEGIVVALFADGALFHDDDLIGLADSG